MEAEGGSRIEEIWVNSPTSWLVDIVTAWGPQSCKSTSTPSGTPSPCSRRWWVPSTAGQSPKRAHHSPTSSASILKAVPLPLGPTEGIAETLGSSTLPMCYLQSYWLQEIHPNMSKFMWYLHVIVFICVNNMCNMCNYVYICVYIGQICIIMHF